MKSYARLMVVVVSAGLFAGCASAGAATPGPTTPTQEATAATQPSAATQAPGPRAAPGAGLKSIAEVTRGNRKIEGLFTVFQDTLTGSTHLMVLPEQLGQEFIYWTHTVDGVVDAGHFRGRFRDNSVFTVERAFNRLQFVVQPTQFHFDPESPLSRAASANVSPAVLVAEEIVAADPATGALLIKADGIFLAEAMSQVKPASPPGPQQGFALGTLSRTKTRYVDVRSYPLNTDVVVDYVYENPSPSPMGRGSAGVTDPRSVTVRVQHTFLAMPENDYAPRFDDPRVGFFTERLTDMSSTSATPYRDLIQRWHLVRKDPDALLSEPVEPIVFWIENTTPYAFRDAVRDATLAWNRAFEAAGFRDAVRVEIQPDDADWDAGDLRYNVIRWTASPNPPFGGYGPSFTNPRTGQILGADIMLEYTFVTSRLQQDRLFETAALGHIEPFDAGELAELHEAGHCTAGLHLQNAALFGMQALKAAGVSDEEMTDYITQSIYYLVLHEVGHTLGLNHNMRATQLWSPAELNNAAVTSREGLYGSVMDYPAVNLSPDRSRQGEYWISTVGPYDRWAIAFGYDPRLDDAAAMRAHLDRSTEPELAFGNDADDMRSPGKAIDPRVNIYDLSSDAIGYAGWQMQLARDLQHTLLERYDDPGESYHSLRNAYMTLTGQQSQAAGVVSRYIGGVYVDRAVQGQPGATRPFTPVSRGDQKRAMETLRRFLFAPDAFAAPPELYGHLAMQRRGFDFFPATEDPKLHGRALNAQRAVLAHLLHPVVMQRITDSRLYGNDYPLAEMMADLTGAIFDADRHTNVNTFRQNLQIEYVNRLAAIITDSNTNRYDFVARSAALASLRGIDGMLAGKGGNAETRAHSEHVRHLVRLALNPRG
jgi:hypothetical protein